MHVSLCVCVCVCLCMCVCVVMIWHCYLSSWSRIFIPGQQTVQSYSFKLLFSFKKWQITITFLKYMMQIAGCLPYQYHNVNENYYLFIYLLFVL